MIGKTTHAEAFKRMNSVKEDNWVIDDEKTRGYDGKTLEIVGRGIFVMRVREANSKGKTRPGYVQVLNRAARSQCGHEHNRY